MATTTAEALEALQNALSSLEEKLVDSTTIINSEYKEATKLAERTYKEAIAIADKNKEKALEEFKKEKAEIINLKTAIKALTGVDSAKNKNPKSGETKKAKFTIPATYAEANTDAQKVYFAIKELEIATTAQILTKVNSYGNGFDTKAITNNITSLKNKFQVIKEDGKLGKAFKYIVK